MKITVAHLMICLSICSFFQSDTSLKEVFKQDFLIGAAIDNRQAAGEDKKALALIKRHFNTITPENMLKWERVHPENMLKWERVHPEPEEYHFEPVNQYIALGEENNMFIIGHTLLWHQQTPDWVFEDDAGKEIRSSALLDRMQNHIETVAGRYQGKIKGWDVVNEALEDDGSLRQTPWLRIIGEDYLAKAFTFAHEAAPDAELYYNDYNLWKPSKREGAIRIVQKLQQQGVHIDGIGMQGHYGLNSPSLKNIEESILAFSALGVKVMITELDIEVLPRKGSQGADLNENFEKNTALNPYPDELPASVQHALADRYASLFELFLKHRDKISRVTFWGVADHDSWLNNWPMRGRTNYPLLFDRDYQPKPAFEAVVKQADKY